MAADPARSQVWSRYWAGGTLHSCAGSFDANYGGAIADFWRQAFAALPVPARVLDIASGNGPLAQMLLGQRPEPAITCDAVDLARVSPGWAAGQPRVCFHPAVAAEALPFGDASFDLVASQFGVEYSELDRALAEVQRVRKPGSTVHFVLHHAGSVPVALAQAEIAHISWALGPAGLLDAAAGLLEPLARSRSAEGLRSLAGDGAARLAREAFNSAQDATDARLAGSPCPDVLHDIRDHVGASLTEARNGRTLEARQRLDRLAVSLQDALLRLRELRLHALDEAGALAVGAALLRPGETSRLQTLADGTRVLGWGLSVGPG
jgi:SAM-dependent methyltransferase